MTHFWPFYCVEKSRNLSMIFSISIIPQPPTLRSTVVMAEPLKILVADCVHSSAFRAVFIYFPPPKKKITFTQLSSGSCMDFGDSGYEIVR